MAIGGRALGLVLLLAAVLAVADRGSRVSSAPQVTEASAQAPPLFLPLALAASAPEAAPSPLPSPLPSASPRPPATATAAASPTPGAAADVPGLYGLTSSYAWLAGDAPGGGDRPAPPGRRFHAGFTQTAFSPAQAVAGDWDGDGLDTLGLYDLRTATFRLQARNAARAQETVFRFGEPFLPTDDGGGVFALAGDWDGDGRDTVGLYDSGAGRFRLRNSNAEGPADLDLRFGQAGMRPLAGDWNGDGVDTIGVYEPATGRAILRDASDEGPPDLELQTGWPGMALVSGDWDGDGADSLAAYDAQAYVFHLRDGLDPAAAERRWPLGSPAARWQPLAGRWDRRGETGEQAGYPWPTAAPEEVGIDAQRLAEAYAEAARTENLHSLLVVREGRLVGEAYYGGYDATMANCLKSVSKSLLAALYGLAIEDGHLRGVDDRVARYLPGAYDSPLEPRLGRTSIEQLLTMTGGQAWDDDTHIAPMVRSPDWVAHVAGLPFQAEPGQRWDYSTGLTHVGSALLEAATGRPTHDYARERLLEPLGISVTRWDRDPQGRDFGGAEVWMRPRDMARFGELHLRGGRLDGRQLLPEAWVRAATSAQVKASGPHDYGYWWWRRDFAGHPTYFAWGYGGQLVFVVEELDLVVVTTSAWFRGAAANTSGPVFRLLEERILPAVTGG